MFNWFSAISALPYIIMGIQQIHTDAAGATKKQLALESLGLAASAGQALLPGNAAQIQALSGAIGGIIDSMVTAFHATNAPGFGTPPAPPAPAA